MLRKQLILLIFMSIIFSMNNAYAIIAHHNDSTSKNIVSDYSEAEDTPKERVSLWKILREFKKLKKELKRKVRGAERGRPDGRALVGWGLLLMFIPLIAMLVYRIGLFSGWILPLIFFVGVIILFIGIFRWVRRSF